MTNAGKHHGALVYLGTEHCELTRLGQLADTIFEAFSLDVHRMKMLADNVMVVAAGPYSLTLTRSTYFRPGDVPAAVSDPGCRITMALSPSDGRPINPARSQRILLSLLFQATQMVRPDYVEWLSPRTPIDADQFIETVTAPDIPRPETCVERFDPVEQSEDGIDARLKSHYGFRPSRRPEGFVPFSEEEALANAMRDTPHPQEIDADWSDDVDRDDIQRFAAWGMTGAVAFLSAPAAATLVVANIVRGESLYANTKVLALTGAVVSLYSTGAMDRVLSLLI